MTKTQKKLFFDFLKVAARCYSGHTPQSFENEPDFFDDKVTTPVAPANLAPTKLTVIEKAMLDGCKTSKDVYALRDSCCMCALFKNRPNNSNLGDIIEVHPVDLAVVTDAPLAEGGLEIALLEKMLESIGLSLKANATLLSTVLCPSSMGAVAHSEEAKACKSLVKRLIELQNPKQVLCLGSVALMHFAGIYSKEGVGKLRQRRYLYNMRQNVCVTHSLDALLQNTSLKRETWQDLQALRKRLDKEQAN